MAKLYTAKSYVHPTAKAYFDKIATAGGSVSDKKAVNDFVIGLSQIIHPSLWVCWPLRSTQNIGTGTIAYSLGGLGDFNGTLVNNPIWGITGTTFSAVNSGMTHTYRFISGSHTIFAAAYNGSVVNNGQIYRCSNAANSFHVWQRRSGTNTVLFAPNTDGLGYVNGVVTNTISISSFFTTAITTARNFTADNGANGCFGDGFNSQQWGDIGAFNSVFSVALSAGDILLLHALYKQTLGKDLALP